MGPLNNGKNPRPLLNHGNKCSRHHGTITKIPHKPRITLGTAAKSSMKSVITCRSQFGATSVKYTAVAMLSGTAMTSAMPDEGRGPKKKGRDPNNPLTG